MTSARLSVWRLPFSNEYAVLLHVGPRRVGLRGADGALIRFGRSEQAEALLAEVTEGGDPRGLVESTRASDDRWVKSGGLL